MNELYKRTIKLPPAIGDWTKLEATEPTLVPHPQRKLSFSSRILEAELLFLHDSHYRWANEQAAHFKKELATSLELQTVTLRQLPYQDFLKESQNRRMVVRFELKSLDIQCYLLLDSPLFDAFLNRSLGSTVESSKQLDPLTLTTLENAALQTLFERPSQAIFERWEVPKEEFSMGPFRVLAQHLDPSIPPSQVLTLIDIAFSLNEVLQGTLSVVYPLPSLKKLLEKRGKTKQNGFSLALFPLSLLSAVKISANSWLGHATIPTRELLKLRVGDVIQLEQKVSDPCSVVIGRTIELPAAIGCRAEHLAVKVHPTLQDQEKNLPNLFTKKPPDEMNPLEEEEETELEESALNLEEEKEEKEEDDLLDF